MALDQEDYETARAMLMHDCTYEIRKKNYLGPDAIIQSYQIPGEWGADKLDSVTYESRIKPLVNGQFAICFIDHIKHEDRRLTHTCQQIVTLHASLKIQEIKHKDLPGEREALVAFFEEAGLDGPNSDT